MRLNKGAQRGQALHRRPVQHKVDRPMRVLGYRTPAEPFADEPPDLQAARPTSRQTYKPDEGVALTNEQRVASIYHDERVRLTGRGIT